MSESALIPRDRDNGQVLVRGPGYGASFGPRVVHLRAQKRAVRGDFPDGDDLLPVQRHQRVELLHGLRGKQSGVLTDDLQINRDPPGRPPMHPPSCCPPEPPPCSHAAPGPSAPPC